MIAVSFLGAFESSRVSGFFFAEISIWFYLNPSILIAEGFSLVKIKSTK